MPAVCTARRREAATFRLTRLMAHAGNATLSRAYAIFIHTKEHVAKDDSVIPFLLETLDDKFRDFFLSFSRTLHDAPGAILVLVQTIRHYQTRHEEVFFLLFKDCF